MNQIGVDLSKSQLSKLKRGQKVRVKKGEGFCLLVHPHNYNLMSRTFGKNKGIELALSPEEIEANKAFSQTLEMSPGEPQMAGNGIFGKKFDNFLEKHHLKNTAYQLGDYAKPLVKGAITAGLATGATALGTAQPQLIPFLPGAVGGLSYLASDYLDNPDRYQGNKKVYNQSGITSGAVKDLTEQALKAKANEQLNKQLGTNYDYMGRAGLENLKQEAENQALTTVQNNVRRRGKPIEHYIDTYGAPASIGHGIHRRSLIHERGSIGRGASMVQSHYIMPPALQSQPHGANFQMQHFLPPQYHGYFDPMLDHGHNNVLGMGLYAGAGLGAGLGTGLYV